MISNSQYSAKKKIVCDYLWIEMIKTILFYLLYFLASDDLIFHYCLCGYDNGCNIMNQLGANKYGHFQKEAVLFY